MVWVICERKRSCTVTKTDLRERGEMNEHCRRSRDLRFLGLIRKEPVLKKEKGNVPSIS